MKLLIKVTTALVVALLYAGWFMPLLPKTDAASPVVLQVFQDMKAKHPDVWAECTDACRADALKDNGWWILPMAVERGVSADDMVKYAVTFSYDWGINLENTKAANTDCRAKSTPALNKCAPTIYDWTTAYANIIESIRYSVAASPQVFAVNTWDENRYFRVKREYGGPF